jgi:aminomethyltransferase
VFVTAPDGGIINDPVLLRLEDNKFWLSLADSDVGLWAQGLAYHSGLDVTIKEIDVAPVQIQGPKSKGLMAELFGDKILDVPYYYMSEDMELNGMRVCVSADRLHQRAGLRDLPVRRLEERREAVEHRAGGRKNHDLHVTGPGHIRRIEGGILAFGCDIWYDTNPFEVDMGYTWMVDLDQEADFVGKEALKKIKAEGPKRKLVGIEIDGPDVGTYIDSEMIDMYPVYQGGQEVGKVTSACHSPRLEKNIGFAMLPDRAGRSPWVRNSRWRPSTADTVE